MYMYRSVLELLSCSVHTICTWTKVYKSNWVVVYSKNVHVHKVQIVRFCIRFCTCQNMYMYKSVLLFYTKMYGWYRPSYIRHRAVVCRIVNWKGLTGCNVTNIWTKFGVWLLWTLFGRPSTVENCVKYIFYSIEWRGAVCVGGGGGRWNCYCEMWIFNIITVHYSARVMNCKLWIVNCKTDYSSLFGPNNEL